MFASRNGHTETAAKLIAAGAQLDPLNTVCKLWLDVCVLVLYCVVCACVCVCECVHACAFKIACVRIFCIFIHIYLHINIYYT